jgi:hypothetical protein
MNIPISSYSYKTFLSLKIATLSSDISYFSDISQTAVQRYLTGTTFNNYVGTRPLNKHFDKVYKLYFHPKLRYLPRDIFSQLF